MSQNHDDEQGDLSMGNDTRRTVKIEEEGRVVAEAEVAPLDEPGTVQAAVHVEPGHARPGAKARVVDEVMETEEAKGAEHVKAVLPRGDAEVLERVRERLDDVTTRPAGASIVVEGDKARPAGD